MHISIVAVGRARQGPERTLFEHYVKRIRMPLNLREVPESRGISPVEIRKKTTSSNTRVIPVDSRVVALDERGRNLTSTQFAEHLRQWRDDGIAELIFIIGGADGLDAGLRDSADLIMSFGRVTWPHLLTRALLAEQLYRTQQILDGHPYHRA